MTCGALDTHAGAARPYDAAGTDPMRHPIDPLLPKQLDALRAHMKCDIKVPSSIQWRVDLAGPPTVVATMDAAALESDFQKDDAAVPCFALCLAWWFERYGFLGGGPVRARVELPSMWTPGPPPP